MRLSSPTPVGRAANCDKAVPAGESISGEEATTTEALADVLIDTVRAVAGVPEAPVNEPAAGALVPVNTGADSLTVAVAVTVFVKPSPAAAR